MLMLISSPKQWNHWIHSLSLEISKSPYHVKPSFYDLPESKRGLAYIYDHEYTLPIWRAEADRTNPQQLISLPTLSSQYSILPALLCYLKKYYFMMLIEYLQQRETTEVKLAWWILKNSEPEVRIREPGLRFCSSH